MNLSDAITCDDMYRTSCAECGAKLGDACKDPLEKAKVHERKSVEAGPSVRVDPSYYTDRPIVLRQAFCPECLALLSTEIVPGDEPSFRKWNIVA